MIGSCRTSGVLIAVVNETLTGGPAMVMKESYCTSGARIAAVNGNTYILLSDGKDEAVAHLVSSLLVSMRTLACGPATAPQLPFSLLLSIMGGPMMA